MTKLWNKNTASILEEGYKLVHSQEPTAQNALIFEFRNMYLLTRSKRLLYRGSKLRSLERAKA
jgi:hypothetical protein